jgi:hypothetical protein
MNKNWLGGGNKTDFREAWFKRAGQENSDVACSTRVYGQTTYGSYQGMAGSESDANLRRELTMFVLAWLQCIQAIQPR